LREDRARPDAEGKRRRRPGGGSKFTGVRWTKDLVDRGKRKNGRSGVGGGRKKVARGRTGPTIKKGCCGKPVTSEGEKCPS